MADFGYDVADHTDVHPMFGTLADLREAMCDVLRFWMDRGIDGFRVDVAHPHHEGRRPARQPVGPPLPRRHGGPRRPGRGGHPRLRMAVVDPSNHDKPRFPTRIGRACARQALVFLLTARGTAVLYTATS